MRQGENYIDIEGDEYTYLGAALNGQEIRRYIGSPADIIVDPEEQGMCVDRGVRYGVFPETPADWDSP